MKYYFFNKVAMAVLLALLLFFGTRTLIDVLWEEKLPETPGYVVAGAEEDLVEGEEKKEEEDKGALLIAALNKADPAKGEKGLGICMACHGFEKGAPNKLGPGLYGIMGMKIASHEGFTYSAALKDHGGEWTFENMSAWLESPQTFAPGTTMAYAGLKDLQKRADLIAYLNQNSDNPLPIPEPQAAPEPEGAPAGEEAAAGADADAEASQVLSLLAEADPAQGKKDGALCLVCHTIDAGGPSLVGPNLHNIMGAKIGHIEDFNYSQALLSKGGDWTYERMDAWLENPQAFAPGTTMAFPGIPDAKKRANVVAFLRSITENPPPLPGGDAVAAPAEDEAQSENADDPAEAAEDEAPAEAPAADEAKDEPAPAEEEAKPAEEAAPAQEDAAPAEAPAADEPKDEAAPAEDAAPADEPAATEPEATETEIPAAADAEPADEGTKVMSPEVSEDAPSLPHKGEPPSPNQPQPVVPSDTSSATTSDDASGTADDNDGADDDGSDDSDDKKGLSAQPQPVYPHGKPDGI